MFNATVTKNIRLNSELFKLFVKMDSGALPIYLPGQYTTLGLPVSGDETGRKFLKRAYSICSSPDTEAELEFFITLVDGGDLTPELLLLQAGDRVLCGPKITGHFTLSSIPPKSRLVLVGTGTGIASYLSMIRTKSTWENFSDVVLINGVRYEQDLAYADEIESIIKANPGLKYLPIVSRPQGQWTGHTGRVQKLFIERIVEISPGSHVFLCGNPAMIKETQALLETFGLNEHTNKQAGNIHIEKYW